MTALARYTAVACVLAILIVFAQASTALAANEGQELLDQATETRLEAQTPQDLSEVIRLAEEAIKKGLDDTNKQFANNLLSGTLLQRANLFAGAIFEKSRPDRRWPQMRAAAIKDLERALEIEPKIGEAHFLIARLHALPGGDRDLAAQGDREGAGISGQGQAGSRSGVDLVRESQFRQRETDGRLQGGDRVAPGNEDAIRSRGLYYLIEGKYEEAAKDFEAAIAIEPEDATTHEAKGVALLMLKKLDEAETALDEAIELSPESPLPFMHRGRVRQKKEFKSAIEDFTKSLELDPDNLGADISCPCAPAWRRQEAGA